MWENVKDYRLGWMDEEKDGKRQCSIDGKIFIADDVIADFFVQSRKQIEYEGN